MEEARHLVEVGCKSGGRSNPRPVRLYSICSYPSTISPESSWSMNTTRFASRCEMRTLAAPGSATDRAEDGPLLEGHVHLHADHRTKRNPQSFLSHAVRPLSSLRWGERISRRNLASSMQCIPRTAESRHFVGGEQLVSAHLTGRIGLALGSGAARG